MNKIGSYLRDARNRCQLSLNDVFNYCGITNSKLSRMERGKGKMPEPVDLRKLAQLYEIDIIPLYIMAGYLVENDLSNYQFVFRNAELLKDDEKQSIQTQINLFTKGRQVCDNGI